ncbi:hypothetical protein [Sphingomonas sp.]|uniref:hypothetical protein n=1 Tax=Sphingomonas sp. TaxID=28214 RepID=UPI00286DCE17|nr:hypothetical protein [Sphingomonas sp.]
MLGIVAIALQAAAAGAPDIQLHATLDARSVKIERKGTATVRAWAEPDGGSASASTGTRASNHFELRIDARIADLLAAQNELPAEATATDPPR